jgi:predicted phage terminase large subunit-like protein
LGDSQEEGGLMEFYEIPIAVNDLSCFPERFPAEKFEEMRKAHGEYVYACQYLLDPVPPEFQVFRRDWLKWWTVIPRHCRVAISVDPAAKVRKTSDFSAFVVHGWDERQRWYVLDLVMDKLSHSERAEVLFRLHRKWSPHSQWKVVVLYEAIGFDSDIVNIRRLQAERNYWFQVVEMSGGLLKKTSKEDRIRMLQPYMERGEFYLPRDPIRWMSHWEKRRVDLKEKFLGQLLSFPRGVNDDLLDAASMPMFWRDFQWIRAAKAQQKDQLPEMCLANVLAMADRYDALAAIPENAGFSVSELVGAAR